MNYLPRPLQPLPRPQIADAVVHGNVALDRSLHITIGCVGFMFERDGEDWTGGDAVTVGRGTAIDEAWLTAARTVAVEALRKEIRSAGGAEVASDTIRCEDCGRLLCSTLLADAPTRDAEVMCGPIHVIGLQDGRTLTFRPDGSSAWVSNP
jgi:hypothetical protein